MDGTKQVKWYDQGVGTKWYDRFIGRRDRRRTGTEHRTRLRIFAKKYEAGDEVYRAGLQPWRLHGAQPGGDDSQLRFNFPKHLALSVAMAYGIYRTREDNVDSFTAKIFRSSFSREIKIKFVGVWDTVGALGIPLRHSQGCQYEILRISRHQFERHRQNAYHARRYR